MKKVPVKNYIFLILLLGVTVVLAYSFVRLYETHQETSENTMMMPFLVEVKEEDIDNYLVENPIAILYISDKTDNQIETKEKMIKNYLTENNLQQYFAYLDISEKKEKALKKFQEKYKVSLDLKKTPILVAVNDGKIVEVYEKETWNEEEIEAFLIRSGVIEDD